MTEEVISKNAGEDLSWVNLKFCSLCPSCMQLNEKKDDSNILSCLRCKKKYCHLCNKGIEGPLHYEGQSTCREYSDKFDDL